MSGPESGLPAGQAITFDTAPHQRLLRDASKRFTGYTVKRTDFRWQRAARRSTLVTRPITARTVKAQGREEGRKAESKKKGIEDYTTQNPQQKRPHKDDQEGDPDETNPFSFKEFIKTKSQSVTKEKERKRQTPKKISSTVGAASHRVCMASKGLSLKLPFRGHCSPDPMEHSPSLDEDEDDWSEAYQPAAIEVAHDLCQASFTSLLLSSKEPVQQVRPQYILSEWEVDDEEEEEEKVNDDGDAPVQQYDLDGEVLYQTQFLNDEKLKEENTRLRMQIKEAKRLVKDHAKKARKLEAELESRKIKEEKETRALESMVQQVEQNLQLMTKQAAKAENIVGKLKQELAVVQNQRDQYKIENERLRHADSEALNTAKTNARVASTYLRKTTQDAETSVKQLLSGAETLRLVSDLLRSIDRISELQPQDKESEQS